MFLLALGFLDRRDLVWRALCWENCIIYIIVFFISGVNRTLLYMDA